MTEQQLGFEVEGVERAATQRELTLARMLAGFVIPGMDAWQRIPQPMRAELLATAQAALERAFAKKAELGL